jgi:hypothetical protein
MLQSPTVKPIPKRTSLAEINQSLSCVSWPRRSLCLTRSTQGNLHEKPLRKNRLQLCGTVPVTEHVFCHREAHGAKGNSDIRKQSMLHRVGCTGLPSEGNVPCNNLYFGKTHRTCLTTHKLRTNRQKPKHSPTC